MISKFIIIGIDIGGSKVNFIVFSAKGGFAEGGDFKKNKIVFKKLAPVPAQISRKNFLSLLEKNLKDLIQKFGIKNVSGIGIGIPGQLDLKSGKILNSPNLKILSGLALGKIIEKKLKLPVKIENDARAFTLAEYFFGAGRNSSSIVGITLGSGVGGGIIINGKLIRGNNFSAGEAGHSIISLKLKAKSLKLLSFEDLVSKKAYAVLSKEKPEILQKKAEKGDKNAIKIFNEIGFWLGVGLANLVNILNPDKIVIGGRLAKAGDLLLKPAKKQMEKLIISPLAKKTPVLRSVLGEDAGAIGAACLLKKNII